MKSWKSSKRRSRRPDYILFITNVSLSGVPNTGGLDRVARELDSQCSSLGMKGWHIWHSESVGRLLEKYPDIRTSYASWVLPGDVLSELHSHLSHRKREVGRALQRYLAKEILRDLHVNLDQAGSADDLQISLADVFVDLPIGAPGDFQSRDKFTVLKRLISACDRKASKVEDGSPKDRHSRFVLVGGPGQGKSTASQFLCQLFRAKLTAGTPAGRTADMEKAIELILEHASREGLTPRANRWPVKIPLTQLADDLAHGRAKSILQFIASRVSDSSDVVVNPQDLRDWLGAFPWLVLLDGLDEVPVSSNRDQVMAAVTEFMMDTDELAADVVTVATTRPQGYTEDFSPAHYLHLELKPLNKEQALHYARKLAVARHGAQSDRTERLMSRLEQAADEVSTARLMSSPLQVTIMGVLLDRMGKAPKDRYTLFKDYYRVIYERELEKEGSSTNLLRDHRADIDTIHADVGFLLQTRSERSGDTESRIEMGEFGTIIRRRLESEGHGGAQLEALAKSISRAATDRLVFLVPSRAEEVGFEIRSLQEFWAADALMSGSDEDVRSLLRLIYASSHWRNVFLFAVGKVFADRRHLRDSVIAMVSELNSYSSREDSVTRRLLLGSRLSIHILADGMVKSPKHESVLVDLALGLMAYPAVKELEELAPALSENGKAVAQEYIDGWIHEGRRASEALLAFLATLAGLGDSWALDRLQRIYDGSGNEIRRKYLALGFEMNSTVLLSISATHLLTIQISDISRLAAGRWKRDSGRRLSLSGLPDWFRRIVGFVEHSHDNSESAPYIVLGSTRVALGLQLLGGSSLWKAMDIDGIPDGHWISMVHRFSSDPSTLALAAAVSAIERAGVDMRYDVPMFPWPIGAALHGIATGVLNHDDLAESTVVGSVEDWLRNESSWIGEVDLKAVTGEFPACLPGADSFLPLSSAVARFLDGPTLEDVKQWIPGGLDAISACSDNMHRAYLAHIVMTAVFHGSMFSRSRLPRNVWGEEEVRCLQQLSEFALAWRGRADLRWVSKLKTVDGNLINWLDQIGREWAGNVWVYRPPAAVSRAWVSDFSMTGLGVLVSFSSLDSLPKTALAKVRREWKAVRRGEITDARRRGLAALAVSSFDPCVDLGDLNDRLSSLVDGVRAGAFDVDAAIEQMQLAHDPLQHKLLLEFLDALDEVGYETWESAYEHLVSDQTSVLTSIDFASVRS
ncbi:hypothetical protein FHX73_113911 [Kitasatospora viridis]|uniref:NACHT domain-containing protein n=2 Tax=Kitasatospora viridis TaxID=281105 RepID=A0A561UL13_9ACTN|nr:hypothetical protein FHX73_113911 [Kitasatospora viridis]